MHITNLRLSVLASHVGTEIKAGRVDAPSCLGDISSGVRQVSFGCTLHLTKLTTESYNCPPQRQQAAMFSTEVLVERL